jgi:hypothetical protein
MGDAIAQADELRDRFYLARKRLEAIPVTGLSADGQPYIREIAEALQSFAAWFGELTLDEISLTGSAYRVLDALNGLDAIADWVGLHRSQPFAADIREHVSELVEQSEALDKAVSAAFTVKRTPAKHILSRNRRIPQAKGDAIDDGIQEVASLAGHLAVRLQRVAAMVPSRPDEKKPAAKQAKKRNRKGIGGVKRKYPDDFVRDVQAARKREEKACRKSKERLPSKVEWLRLYCRNRGIDTAKMFPSKDEAAPEPWDVRANRFWHAVTARESRDEN